MIQHGSIFLLTVAAFIFISLSGPDAFVHSFSTIIPPFRRFQFSPNSVSTKPHTFFCKNIAANNTEKNSDLVEEVREFSMRNVPGEGDCMFQSIALATSTSLGLGGNNALLRAVALEIREVVAQILAANGTLYITGKRIVRAKDLLNSAAKSENVEATEYLEMLRNGTLQGGGPELTCLSNILRRPISIYELKLNEAYNFENVTIPDVCEIQCVGSFGDVFIDPIADIPDHALLSDVQEGAYSWHIHILVVDAGGGEKHACTLLPKTCYL